MNGMVMKNAALLFSFLAANGALLVSPHTAFPRMHNLQVHIFFLPDSAADAKLVEKAVMLGMKEVQESEAAQTKAQNPKIREFAGRMVSEHTQANKDLVAIAAANNLAVPTGTIPDRRELMETVNDKAGPEFEKKYLKSMVKDHQKAISFYERAAGASLNPALKAFFTTQLSKLRAHLAEAQQLQ